MMAVLTDNELDLQHMVHEIYVHCSLSQEYKENFEFVKKSLSSIGVGCWGVDQNIFEKIMKTKGKETRDTRREFGYNK